MAMIDNSPTGFRETPGDKQRSAFYLLLAFYILVYILPLGFRPLVIPDETRYAEIPREMIQSGDWIAPHLNGLRYFEKPPLGYWLNAISIELFGENAFAVRLPAALSAGLIACLIGLLLRRSRYDRTTALTASTVFLGTCAVLFTGTFAILDMPLSLFLTAGIIFFFVAAESEHIAYRRRWLLASGVALGLAFLTKGFLAFVIPGMVLLPWIIWEKRYPLLLQSLWAVAGCLVTVAPWALAIYFREDDFWRYFIVEEHIKRFTSGDAQHAAPFYYYLICLPPLVFPWLAFIPAAGSGLHRDLPPSPLYRLLLLWIILPFLFFSISSGKLATYILPCFVPITVLLTIGLIAHLKPERARLFRYGAVFNVLVFALIIAAFIYWAVSGKAQNVYYTDAEGIKSYLLSGMLVLSLALTAGSFLARNGTVKIGLIAASAVPLFCALGFLLPQNIILKKAPVEFLQQMRSTLSGDDVLVADGLLVRAVNWAFKRDDVYMLSPSELEYGLGLPEGKNRLLDVNRFMELLENARSEGKSVAVFCKRTCPQGIIESMPAGTEEYSGGPFKMWLARPPASPD